MRNSPATSPSSNPQILKAANAELGAKVCKLEKEREQYRKLYQEMLEKAKKIERGLLGQKAERLPPDDAQLSLLLLAGLLGEREAALVDEPDDEESGAQLEPEHESEHGPEKARHKPTGRRRMPENLPVVKIELIPDDNGSERELRRLAVGRKNWLFVGNDDAGQVTATFVTLIASCEMHGIEPWSYLRDLFCLLPEWPRHRILELCPARWKETLEDELAQQRLGADPFRQITLGAFDAQLDKA